MNNTHYGKKAETDLRLWSALSNCYQSVKRKTENLINDNGLTLSQYSVLELLYHEGNLSISGLMQKMQSTPGNMTVVIENLLQQKLIKKNKDAKDKRVNIISITKKGENKVKSIIPTHILNLQNIFHKLDAREKSALIDLSEKLEASI